MNELLIDNIHSTVRKIQPVNLFKFKCKVVMLDFIQADQYLITDFGAIWHRQKIFTNTFGYLNKGWEPLVFKDSFHRYPWVLLRTSGGERWFPVNQLYGWAFDPQTDKSKRYYLSNIAGILPINPSNYFWTDKCEEFENSLYCRFMKQLYT